MIIFWQIVFWVSVFLILYTYIIFPFLLFLNKKQKNRFDNLYTINDNLPKISILISIYNEELVISEKIESIIKSDYPVDKIEIIIGSDCSDDRSNEIVEQYCEKYNFIHFKKFDKRQGKPSVINQIQKNSTGEILILTDANVIFDKRTIYELVKYFKDDSIGLVDSQMINKGIVSNGISVQESSYISREVKIKSKESQIWGTMMGPFGGCYAIRKNLYAEVPKNFLVDDFYINMKIFEQGYKAINCVNAVVYEDVSNNLKDEFRRKKRIATGNFQNLNTFKHLLWAGIGIKSNKISYLKKYSLFGLSFSFFSHKVVRWLVPFFMILILISGAFLLNLKFYLFSYLSYLALLFLPIIDYFLKKIKVHLSLLRFTTHFLSMNLALLLGFIKFITGVKSGVWNPTKRNQTRNQY